MSRKFTVKSYNGTTTKAGNPSYNKATVSRKKILQILNSRENVPEVHQNVPACFITFGYNRNSEGNLKNVSLRVAPGVDVTSEMKSFVKDVFEPELGRNSDELIVIETKRNYRPARSMRSHVFENLDKLVEDEDNPEHLQLARETRDLVNELLK